jgi:endoglucanase
MAGTAIVTVSLLCGAAAAGAVGGAAAGGAAAGVRAGGTASVTPVEVRVNQAGYATGSPKVAYAMLPRQAGQVSFTVAGRRGVVFMGRPSADAGNWNAAYRAVYRLDFTGLHRTGAYRITVHAGAATAVSPVFTVAPPATLYHRLVLNGVRYFTSERDGAAVGMPCWTGGPPTSPTGMPGCTPTRATTATTTCSARSTGSAAR